MNRPLRTQSSLSLHQRVLDNLTAAVLLFDSGLRLRYANPAAEMLFAASARHLLGLPAEELFAQSTELMQTLREAFASGHPLTQRELVLQVTAERRYTLDLTAMPVLEPGEERALLVELIPIDRQLRISREEHLLAQQDAARQLLRGLAHEVKNPLGGLRGAAQLLERQLQDADLKEYTSVIIGEADRLQNLVDRMLGPRALPQRQDTNVHELLERVRSLVRAEVGEGVHLHRDYDPSIPDLYVDPELIIQALLNIVRNAVQAMGTEGGNITLRTRVFRQYTLGLTRHKLVASIEIIDDGPGIAPELLDKIFYPMVTSRAEGSGLGLSIAQSLIQQHGGLIECSSRPGRTVFSILIPLPDAKRGTS